MPIFMYPIAKNEVESIWLSGYWYGKKWGIVFGILFGLIIATAASPFILMWMLRG